MDRLSNILAGMDRTATTLARLPARAATESRYDPFERRPFDLTPQQHAEQRGSDRNNATICRECLDPWASWDDDGGTPTCTRCGAQGAAVPSSAFEKRFFADQDENERNTKKRNEEYNDEENAHLSRIQAREIPSGCTKEQLWLANNRLNQCIVWLELQSDKRPGGFCLTSGEIRSGRIVLRAVCVQWAIEGFADANFGSPVVWAIAITLQLVAMRPGGYVMPTKELCKRVTLEGLHTYLRQYKGQAMFMATESQLVKTKAKGRVAAVQYALEVRVWRHAAFHELGKTPHKRYEKLLVVHKLLKAAKVWDGAGLDARVLKLKGPKLASFGEEPPRLSPVCRKVVGLAGTKRQARTLEVGAIPEKRGL